MSTTELPSSFGEILSPGTAPTAPAADGATPSVPPADEPTQRRSRGSSRRAARPDPQAAPAVDLQLSAYPVARLLPPEVIANGKVRTTRTLMMVLVALVLLLALTASYGARVIAHGAQNELTGVEGQNSSVLAQESKYAPVRVQQSKVQLAKAAQQVGAASEIDWTDYFAKVYALLPAGVTVTDISGQTASPTTAVTQDSAPLAAGRAAIVTLTVTAPNATAIANATDAFQKLPGYADAVIGAMTQGGGSPGGGATTSGSATSGSAPGGSAAGARSATSSSWSASITISLTQAAFSGRYGAATK
ncbi:hypothetical protein ACFOYW_03530 [Gryllotalpicola reticulitermitis]|uniref:Fimbrial assembly protein (PilN) n=1 Tax=Gryllotalpicola reticulitermitis TaxID=1184153 RepID=A0ABV8Q497_9MICO